MNRLVIACVLVRGHVNFTPEYVFKLRNMAKRCAPEHEFVCLTDQPENLPGIECVAISTPRDMYAWWAKLELFNKSHAKLRDCRILYLDLDVLLVDQVDAILECSPSLMAIVPDGAPNFMGKDGLKVVKRFNSSVMCWRAGDYDYLYDEWTPDVAKRLWGDQDWLGEKLELARLMPLEWFPRLSQITQKGNVDRVMKHAKVVLCKRPKNTAAAKQWPWFRKAWV